MTDVETTSRGWKRKKYYLSDEAVALLIAHCKGTPLTMSAYLDGLIKAQLTPAGVASSPPAAAEIHEVLAEGQRQINDLTAEPATGILTEQPAEPRLPKRPGGPNLGDYRTEFTKQPSTKELQLRQLDKINQRQLDKMNQKQPTKKDFDIDL